MPKQVSATTTEIAGKDKSFWPSGRQHHRLGKTTRRRSLAQHEPQSRKCCRCRSPDQLKPQKHFRLLESSYTLTLLDKEAGTLMSKYALDYLKHKFNTRLNTSIYKDFAANGIQCPTAYGHLQRYRGKSASTTAPLPAGRPLILEQERTDTVSGSREPVQHKVLRLRGHTSPAGTLAKGRHPDST